MANARCRAKAQCSAEGGDPSWITRYDRRTVRSRGWMRHPDSVSLGAFMSMRTRRKYGLPWPWHLLRAPHPPRPVQISHRVRPVQASKTSPELPSRTHLLKASTMPEVARSSRIAEGSRYSLLNGNLRDESDVARRLRSGGATSTMGHQCHTLTGAAKAKPIGHRELPRCHSTSRMGDLNVTAGETTEG